MGWSGIQNGDLINIIDGKFDILITGDQNLRYQQNLKDRQVSIIELPFTRLDQLKPLSTLIQKAIVTSRPGGYTQIKIP